MVGKLLLIFLISQVSLRPGNGIISDARGVGAVRNLLNTELAEELQIPTETVSKIRVLRDSLSFIEPDPVIQNGKVMPESVAATADAIAERELESMLSKSVFRNYSRWAVKSYLSSDQLSGMKDPSNKELRLLLLPGVVGYLGISDEGYDALKLSIQELAALRIGWYYQSIVDIESTPEAKRKLDYLLGRPSKAHGSMPWGLVPVVQQAAYSDRSANSISELPDCEAGPSSIEFVCNTPEFPIKPQIADALRAFRNQLRTEYTMQIRQIKGEEAVDDLKSLKADQSRRATLELKKVLNKEQWILLKQWYFRNQLNQGLSHFFSNRWVLEYLGDDLNGSAKIKNDIQQIERELVEATHKAHRELFLDFVKKLDDQQRNRLANLLELPAQ